MVASRDVLSPLVRAGSCNKQALDIGLLGAGPPSDLPEEWPRNLSFLCLAKTR